MGNDWNEPRDTGPQIEETVKKWKKAAKGRKRFAIESRYTGPTVASSWLKSFYDNYREWHVVRRYRTEKQRDQALANLQHKQTTTTYPFMKYWEYRKHEP